MECGCYLAAKQVEQVAITVALEIQLSNCPTAACEKESYSTKKVMTNRQALEKLREDATSGRTE